MLEEMLHFGFEDDEPSIGFLMLISIYKEDFPWFYEIGVDTYRGLKTVKSNAEHEKVIRTFERATEMLSHPVMREFNGESKDNHFIFKRSNTHVSSLFGTLCRQKIREMTIYIQRCCQIKFLTASLF
jgi:hypothetical protein